MTAQLQRIIRIPTLCLLATLALPAWCAAATQMRPGEWQVTVRMEMPGMPAQAQQAHTSKNCVTPEMAENPRAAAEQLQQRDQGDTRCAMADYTATGNGATWRVECTGAHPAKMHGTMTYDSDSSYHGTTRMLMQGPSGTMEMTQKITARRIGDCRN